MAKVIRQRERKATDTNYKTVISRLLNFKNFDVMKKTFLFIVFLTLILRGVTTAQNPYESLGVPMPKGKMLTVSNGRFQEHFPNDTLTPIGSAMFNTVTGEVVQFLTRDTMYAEYNLEPELVSRWLSPDPLAERYLQWSPYNYTLNNPIIYTDPDGRSVEGDFYNQKGTKIGNDGNLTDGKKYIVFDKTEANNIATTDKAGGTTQLSDIKSAVSVSKDIMAAAGSAVSGQDGTGFEHGFVAATDGTTSSLINNGKEGAVQLGPGYEELQGKGKTSEFDVHTHPADWKINADGTATKSEPTPSGDAGKQRGDGDYNYRGMKESKGQVSTANSWIIGTQSNITKQLDGTHTASQTKMVSFYNNASTVKTMEWRDFKKLADKVLK
jgi:RHS repeat-associated protein